jgi:hypothetical protein
MVDWLEIANTIINKETFERINQISNSQRLIATQKVTAHISRQRDNEIFSRLVDIHVDVMQRLQDNQILEAVLNAGSGLIIFEEIYLNIINAETKLKVADLQLKLFETIRTSVLTPNLRSILHSSLTEYLINLNNLTIAVLSKIKNDEYKIKRIDLNNFSQLKMGMEIFVIEDLQDHATTDRIFQKNKFYSISHIDDEAKGFYVMDDWEEERFIHANLGREAEYFRFVDPEIPKFEYELDSWNLITSLFTNDNLGKMRSVHQVMYDIFSEALASANVTQLDLTSNINECKSLKKEFIKSKFQYDIHNNGQVAIQNNKSAFWLLIIPAIIAVLVILRSC